MIKFYENKSYFVFIKGRVQNKVCSYFVFVRDRGRGGGRKGEGGRGEGRVGGVQKLSLKLKKSAYV